MFPRTSTLDTKPKGGASKFLKGVKSIGRAVGGFFKSSIGQTIMAPIAAALPFAAPVMKGLETVADVAANLPDFEGENYLDKGISNTVAPSSEKNVNDMNIRPETSGSRTSVPMDENKNIGDYFSNAQARAAFVYNQTSNYQPTSVPTNLQSASLRAFNIAQQMAGPVITGAGTQLGFLADNGLPMGSNKLIMF